MKAPSIHIIRFVLPMAAALLLGACQSTPIFRANFDSDTLGALPNPDPPGAPAGDAIWSTAGSDTAMYAVVNSPVLGSRSVRFSNTGPIVRYVGYLPKDISPAADQVFAYWSGTVSSGPISLDVWLGNTHFAAFAGLRFANGEVQVRSGSDYEMIGTYTPNQSHVVVIGVNKTAGTYDVSFLQGSQSASREDIPILSAAALATTRPTLYMAYFDTSGGGTYIADGVIISEKAPAP